MTRFFWRIFLSAWAIVLIATALTFWAANLVTDSDSTIGGSRFTAQMTTLIARELRRELAADPAAAVDNLVAEYVLDFSPVLEIYVLDPGGEDVLGRPLPGSVPRHLESRGTPARASVAREFSQLHVRGDGDRLVRLGRDPFGVRASLRRGGGFPRRRGRSLGSLGLGSWGFARASRG